MQRHIVVAVVASMAWAFVGRKQPGGNRDMKQAILLAVLVLSCPCMERRKRPRRSTRPTIP